MKKYSCPSCGAALVFQSSLSVYAVCAYCSATVVRHDVNLEAIGTMAALPDDMSPFQVGTEAYYRGNHFTLIGRMKVGWKNGVWNEWFMMTDDGRKGWLAEAQGFYAVCFEVENAMAPEMEQLVRQRVLEFMKLGTKTKSSQSSMGSLHHQQLGAYITLNRQKLRVVDIKHAMCIGSEGELPFAAPWGRKSISIDLLGPDGEFGCVEVIDQEIRVFVGHYVDWADLRCERLREIEGW